MIRSLLATHSESVIIDAATNSSPAGTSFPWPTAFGIEGTRTLNGEELPENNCSFHRNHGDGENRDFERRECGANGVTTPGGRRKTPSARPPTRRRAPGEPGGDDDAPWSDDDIKGLVRALVGMPFDAEGQRGSSSRTSTSNGLREPGGTSWRSAGSRAASGATRATTTSR